MTKIISCLLALSLCACSAHSPLIVKNTTDVYLKSGTVYQPHVQRVLVVRSPLPPDVKYEFIAQVEAGRIWYGGERNIIQQIADRARELGADAVIEVRTWHQPSGFAWAAPHGAGKAVKILDRNVADLKEAGGEWY